MGEGKYYPGKGCKCEAWDVSECACGADWRSCREVELEAENKRIKDQVAHLVGLCRRKGVRFIEDDKAGE